MVDMLVPCKRRRDNEYAGVWITKKVNHLHYLHLFILVGLVQLQDDTQSPSGEKDVKFQLAKDTLETMLKSMYYVRDQLSTIVSLLTTFAYSVCDQRMFL